MAKLNDDLQILQDTRDNIKQAIISKGQDVNNDIRTYAEAIESIKADTPELSQAITDLENQVQELTNELANKTAGSGAKLNIYTQTTEPEEKEGIWLNTNNKFDKIEFADAVVAGEKWDNVQMTIPYEFYNGSAVSINTDIYLFGGNASPNNKMAYKYDTLTGTYTKLTNIPYIYAGSVIAVIGTDIYLFSSSNTTVSNMAYKYNTLTDTYTKLANTPVNFCYGSANAIGTDIYFLEGVEAEKYIYKYDTLTDTYTKLIVTTYNNAGLSTAVIGTDIFLFGGYQTTVAYKWDTLAGTIIQLSNIPSEFYNGSVSVVGTNIYLFGDQTNKTTVYKYDTLTDTYTQLTNIPYDFHNGASVVVMNNIYLLGGIVSQNISELIITFLEFEDNSLIIHNGTTYKTQLYTNDKVEGRVLNYFNNVYDYTEEKGLQQTYDTYYGDGTQWVEIK